MFRLLWSFGPQGTHDVNVTKELFKSSSKKTKWITACLLAIFDPDWRGANCLGVPYNVCLHKVLLTCLKIVQSVVSHLPRPVTNDNVPVILYYWYSCPMQTGAEDTYKDFKVLKSLNMVEREDRTRCTLITESKWLTVKQSTWQLELCGHWEITTQWCWKKSTNYNNRCRFNSHNKQPIIYCMHLHHNFWDHSAKARGTSCTLCTS